MSRSLDLLSSALSVAAKESSDKAITKDNLADLIEEADGLLSNSAQFFESLGDKSSQLLGFIESNRRTNNMKSMLIYNQLISQLSGAALKAMNERFLGGMHDTISGFRIICGEVQANIDKLFVDKRITLYNTKISHVAVFGMLNNAKIFAEFVTNFVSAFMSDKCPSLAKPAPYVYNSISNNLELAANCMNRMLNLKLGKTFTNSVMKYRSGGSDMAVMSSDNHSTVAFAKLNNDVTDADIVSGARGLKIFKLIGDWWTDRQDRANRKRRAERDVLQARARLLQLELDGMSQNDEAYKRQVKIIENYQKMIDRLNQEIEKYENS